MTTFKLWILNKYSKIKFKREVNHDNLGLIMICARYENPVIMGTKSNQEYLKHMGRIYGRIFKHEQSTKLQGEN